MSKKILVVDDAPYIIKSLEFVLTKAGYTVSTAEDGTEALKKVSENKPQLMFLDVMMPGKDGYQVCREIKQNLSLKDIYIIMLTAKGQDADREMGLAAGADEYLTKPYSPSEVIERVKKILGE